MTKTLQQPARDLMTFETGVSLRALQALTRRDTIFARFPRFIAPETCEALAQRLQCAGYDDYVNAPSVGRIGMSFFETTSSRELFEHYFETARSNIQALRSACAPYQCPIDIFRCAMDEVWPAGARLECIFGRKMFVGLSRNMRPGTPLLAHHDIFARLAPDAPEANNLSIQLAVNVYIDVPDQGGEIMLWRDEISDAEFLGRRGENYGLCLDPLGAPDVVVKPQIGDLIVFDARKLHAVGAGDGSDRLTLSCFLGFRGDDQPLTFWS